MKPLVRILCIVFVTSLLLQCESRKLKREQLIDFLPDNTSEILKFNDLVTARTSIDNQHTGVSLGNTEIYDTFFKDNSLTAALTPKGKCNLFFSIDKDSIPTYTFVTKHSDSIFVTDSIKGITIDKKKEGKFTIIKNSIDSTAVYTTVKDSFFIATSSQKNLVDLLSKKTVIDPSLLKINSIHQNADIVYIKKNTQLETKHDSQLSGWTSLKSNIIPEGYIGTGVTAVNDSLPQLLRVFKNQSPQPITVASIAPRNVISIVSFTIDDAERLFERIHAFNDVNTQPQEIELFDTSTELGAFTIKSGNAYYLKSLDAELTKEIISAHTKKIDTYRGTQLFNIETPMFIAQETTGLLPSFGANIHFQIDDYFVFAENKTAAQDIISSYLNSDVLSKSIDFDEINTSMSSEASYLILDRGKTSQECITSFLNSDRIKTPVKNSKTISSFQFSIDGSYAHTTVIYKAITPKKKVSASVTEQFNQRFNVSFNSVPQFFKQSSSLNVVIQDENNALHMLSPDGSTTWKKNLDGPILGEVAHVDLYRNNKKQLAFVTENTFYVIDRKGNDVAPFPVKFKDKVTQPLAVFDYENKRKYRFMITQGNEVLMYDRKAKFVNGFTFEKTSSPIIHTPKHLVIGNKDYIVITEERGKLHLLSRTGKERVHTKESFDFGEITVQKEGSNFVVITNNNEKKKITQQGNVNTQKLNISDSYSFQMFGSTKVTLDDNLLRIDGVLVELPLGIYTKPKLVTHKRKKYILITETQENKIYLYTKDRKLVNGFPIYGNGEASMIGNKNTILITTKGDQNELLLYKIQY